MNSAIDRIIREEERRMVTGLSRTTWWRLERNGLAPRRRKLSANSVGWLESELRAWMTSKAEAA
jgi:predicted DNA-binding transcriptional regulator AlpA